LACEGEHTPVPEMLANRSASGDGKSSSLFRSAVFALLHNLPLVQLHDASCTTTVGYRTSQRHQTWHFHQFSSIFLVIVTQKDTLQSIYCHTTAAGPIVFIPYYLSIYLSIYLCLLTQLRPRVNDIPLLRARRRLGIKNAFGVILLANLEQARVVVSPVCMLPVRLVQIALRTR
jgi:hypothetical protein